MSDAIILPFPGNPGAPVQPIVPRSSFGLKRRQIENLAGCLEGIKDALTRPEDRREQDAFKADARAGRADRIAAQVEAMCSRPKIKREDVIAASEFCDDVSREACKFARATGRAAFLIIARDAENLSERLVHLAAEVE